MPGGFLGVTGFVRAGIASLLVLAAGLMLLAGTAGGERRQSGELIVALNGGINPLKLPRHEPAPVAVRLEGRIGTADGSPLPQVKQVKIELAGPGLLYTRGLAVCPRARLRNADSGQAVERCGSALVGSGSLGAQVNIPGQPPFEIRARMLAFNGRTPAGRRAIWLHAFSVSPPISLVLPFVVRPGSGSYPTALLARVPQSIGPLPRLAVFRLNLFRRYFNGGQRRSYISATCPVPKIFTAGFLSFAKATYIFGDNHRVKIDTVRSCRARD